MLKKKSNKKTHTANKQQQKKNKHAHLFPLVTLRKKCHTELLSRFLILCKD